MKKIFLLFAGLSLSFCTLAQNTNVTTRLPQNHNLEGGGGNVDNSGFGIKGGVNFNQLRGDDKGNINNLKNLTTWHAGIYGQFPVAGSRVFSIQPEILFNRRAFEAQDTVEMKMDYLEVPFLFVFNVLDNLSFHVGPQAGVLLTVQENERELGESTKDRMNSFVYGAVGGVEARVSFARVGARYHLGLNEIYKEPSTIAGKTVEDLKNGQFQIYVGVGF
ncbi:PorT family protein [Adhaeribacter sp. BT258]|uniref:PorT family protein n=1 Tax=Adhaeribacter terrigena TaxID=2793070 RepID=A0ABS1C495_9BACT|nr:porin family protein [Adhaeribacter terrigena]MBK0403340.1 PorT family protein [Adhaeribacter terrigena]